MLAPMTAACPLQFSPPIRPPYSVLSGSMADRWRTKSIEQSIADTDEADTQLRRDLSWWHLCVFGVSVVIGAGIFTVTASTAGAITGPAIWISFLIAAITCGLAALGYGGISAVVSGGGGGQNISLLLPSACL